MNAFQRFEYVALRLVRRFVFSERMANNLARWLPYYAPSVGENEPTCIVTDYKHELAMIGTSLVGQRILEVGAGRTNGVGYEMIAAGAESVCLLEPYVEFDVAHDTALRELTATFETVDLHKLRRVREFTEIADASVDLILSHSVLEHVREPSAFFAECSRVLAPSGAMLHRVDYRDHFFKYPYGFLTFSEATWLRWLDPGDLPRWRLDDHLAELDAAGFDVRVLDERADPIRFAQVRNRLCDRFANATPGIDVTGAVLFARRLP